MLRRKYTTMIYVFLIFLAMVVIGIVLDFSQPKIIDFDKFKLNELYAGINGHNISKKDMEHVDESDGCSVYGEILYEGVEAMIRHADIDKYDVFYDLGSGVGKAVVQIALTTPVKKSVGIELSIERFEYAKKVENKTIKKYFKSNIEFINSDIADHDLKDATIVYMNSTCFGPILMEKILNSIKKQKSVRLLISSTGIPCGILSPVYIKRYNLAMSWNESIGVNFYYLK